MTRSPHFSIVTPSFNQAPFIGEALDSVRRQRSTDLEHWVIDGASSDGTVDILGRYAGTTAGRHLRWISEPDTGQSAALNKGFSRVTGEIVGWLNSDDRYRPGCFDYIQSAFDRNPSADVIYGDYTWIDERGQVFRVRREIEFSRFVLLYHRVPFIPSTATFFRRRIFDDGNRLREDLQYAMDFDFFLHLATKGYRFLHVPAVLADFRFQRNSKTCTAPHKQLEEIDTIMHSYSPTLSKTTHPLSRSMARILLRSCAGALRYSEKLMRGYYFNQDRFGTLNS